MKKNLEILDYEDKKTQAGKRFVRFKTSDGWMSCFDSKAAEELKKFEGKTASVEVTESGEFKNIKKCYGSAGEEEEVEVQKIGKPSENQTFKKASNHTTMYVSYAKDIFCAMINTNTYPEGFQEAGVMKLAIDLVKQAKEAFE